MMQMHVTIGTFTKANNSFTNINTQQTNQTCEQPLEHKLHNRAINQLMLTLKPNPNK